MDISKQDSKSELDRIVYLSHLYDFYSMLLNEKQRVIMEDYVCNDMSLTEISKELGITRQGVYDVVKRCCIKLEGYEKKLCLVEKFLCMKEKLSQIRELASKEDSRLSQEIVSLTHDIYNMI